MLRGRDDDQRGDVGRCTSNESRKRRAYIAIEGRVRKKRQKGRRGQTTRRLARVSAREARARQKEALVAVATYNVGTLAVKGKNGYRQAECVLVKARQLGCDFIGLQETRRSGKTEFSAAVPGLLICARRNGRLARTVRSWAGSQGIDIPYVCLYPSVD